MILFRATFSELLSPFFMTFGVMSFILLMDKIYRLVALLAEQRSGLSDVGLMLISLFPQIFAITFPLGVVGAVFMTVIRQSVDSELVTMRAAGMSMWNYAQPFAAFGLATTAMALVFTLWLQPVGYRNYIGLQARMIKSHADEKLVPGEFVYDFGSKVIQVGRREADGNLFDIFISDRILKANSPLILANSGRIEVDEESKQVFFRLEQGSLMLRNNNPDLFRTLKFQQLDYQLEFAPKATLAYNRRKQTSTLDIIATIDKLKAAGKPHSQWVVELHSRLTFPWACFVFSLAAIPMAVVDPRSGKSGSYLRAVFLVLTYYIIWTAFKDLVAIGSAPAIMLWLPLALILSYGMIRLKQINEDTKWFSFFTSFFKKLR